jgi:membrane fusion protein (multidrug efflux system)
MLPELRTIARSLTVFLALALVAGCGKKEPAPGPGGARAEAAPGAPGRGGPPPAPAIPVAVEAAHRGSVASYYAATASLEPDKAAQILARVSGIITEVRAEEGDVVRKGEDLLVIEDDQYRLRLAQAEAEAAKQKMKFDRLQKMFEGSLVSAEEFEAGQNDFKSADAARDLAQLELSYTRVTAPIGGRVVERLVDLGQSVNNNTPLFSIADLHRLLARVHVPAKEFGKLKPDQPVDLSVDSNGAKLQGRITLVSPVIDAATGTIKVTVEVPEYPASVRPGDFAQVRIVTERHPEALLVPSIAVISDKGEQVVYVVADSTAERRVVALGLQDEEHTEVLSGVRDGDRVVVQGQRSLKHGAPIKLLDRVVFEAAKPESAGA